MEARIKLRAIVDAAQQVESGRRLRRQIRECIELHLLIDPTHTQALIQEITTMTNLGKIADAALAALANKDAQLASQAQSISDLQAKLAATVVPAPTVAGDAEDATEIAKLAATLGIVGDGSTATAPTLAATPNAKTMAV